MVMEVLLTPIPYLLIVLCLCLFSMQRHLAIFRGSSQMFHLILVLDITICTIGAVVFLVCWGIESLWWIPVVFGVCGRMIASLIYGLISVLVKDYISSLISIVLAPAILVVMFVSLYDSNTSNEDGVYICTGKSSQVYHKIAKCKGLQSCGDDIKLVSFDRAKALYRRPCKMCKPQK